MKESGARPLQLACLSLVGSAMMSLAAAVTVRIFPAIMTGAFSELSSRHQELRLLVLVPFLCGVALCLTSTICLARGVKQGVWSQDELARTRHWMDHPLWIGVIVMSFLSASSGVLHQPAGYLFMLMFPGQAVLQLKSILKLKTLERRSILGL